MCAVGTRQRLWPLGGSCFLNQRGVKWCRLLLEPLCVKHCCLLLNKQANKQTNNRQRKLRHTCYLSQSCKSERDWNEMCLRWNCLIWTTEDLLGGASSASRAMFLMLLICRLVKTRLCSQYQEISRPLMKLSAGGAYCAKHWDTTAPQWPNETLLLHAVKVRPFNTCQWFLSGTFPNDLMMI